MKTILVPTDFSDAAKSATDYACQLASLLQGEVLLVHAFPFPLPVAVRPIPWEQLEEIKKEVAIRLQNLAHELQERYDILVRHQEIEGFLADELEETVERQEVDLVIMGLRGAHRVTRGLFGSVVANVIEKAVFPVLVIPEAAQFKTIEKIVLATDFRGLEDPMRLRPVRELAELFEAEIQILHVVKKGHALDSHFAMASHQMDRYFYPASYSYHFEEEENVLESIATFLEEENAEIVAMVAHRHTFWDTLVKGTHTRKMMFETRVPLLIIPDPKV